MRHSMYTVNLHTVLSVVDGDPEVLLRPQLLVLQVVHHFVGDVLKVLAVVGDTDNEEAN